jgi:hypothetical protein
MTTAEKVRLEVEAQGLKYRVIDLTPPIETIEAGLSGHDREYIEFIRYSKARSPAKAAIIPAPNEG